jgi:hypothetical protein
MHLKKIAVTIGAGLAAAFLIACGAAGTDTQGGATAAPATSASTAPAAPPTSVEATARPTAAAPTTQSLTNAQKQAIGKAQSYLKVSGFSRKGLIKQLEFEGFTTADATFAVDSLNVDWNAQAAVKAKSYLDMQHFSRKGLIDQLKFEGFTDEQAAYGATANGL